MALTDMIPGLITTGMAAEQTALYLMDYVHLSSQGDHMVISKTTQKSSAGRQVYQRRL